MSELPNQPTGNWKPPFFAIWTGQAFSILGSQLVQFALVWWLTVETGSATVLATATILGMLPQIFLGPLAGTVVDRHSRRRIMIAADSAVALATLVLAILFALGEVQTWQVYLVLFARALAGSFHWPAMAASTSLMVPREHLARVQGANQMLNGGLRILSAPMGALLLSLLPMQGILAIDIATALLAVLPLLVIQIPQPLVSASPSGERPSVWSDLRAGLHYVRKWPGVLTVLIMAALVNLFMTPAFSLLPLLVKDYFSGGAMQLAWMEAAGGIGTILGGLLLGIWGGFHRRIITSLIGLIGVGIGTLVVGVTPGTLFLLAVAAVLWVGFMLPITNGPLLAVIQSVVAPEMQGRVLSLIDSLATAMAPLGLALAGPLSDAVGVRFWFVAAGMITGLMGVAGFLMPKVLYLENQSTINEGEVVAPELPAGRAAKLNEGR